MFIFLTVVGFLNLHTLKGEPKTVITEIVDKRISTGKVSKNIFGLNVVTNYTSANSQ